MNVDTRRMEVYCGACGRIAEREETEMLMRGADAGEPSIVMRPRIVPKELKGIARESEIGEVLREAAVDKYDDLISRGATVRQASMQTAKEFNISARTLQRWTEADRQGKPRRPFVSISPRAPPRIIVVPPRVRRPGEPKTPYELAQERRKK
jgi:hypothetical protein